MNTNNYDIYKRLISKRNPKVEFQQWWYNDYNKKFINEHLALQQVLEHPIKNYTCDDSTIYVCDFSKVDVIRINETLNFINCSCFIKLSSSESAEEILNYDTKFKDVIIDDKLTKTSPHKMFFIECKSACGQKGELGVFCKT